MHFSGSMQQYFTKQKRNSSFISPLCCLLLLNAPSSLSQPSSRQQKTDGSTCETIPQRLHLLRQPRQQQTVGSRAVVVVVACCSRCCVCSGLATGSSSSS